MKRNNINLQDEIDDIRRRVEVNSGLLMAASWAFDSRDSRYERLREASVELMKCSDRLLDLGADVFETIGDLAKQIPDEENKP